MGDSLRSGLAGVVDIPRALSYYRAAAEAKDGGALNMLGYCYDHGVGVAVDSKEARRLYKLSHEQGCHGGTFNYSVCLREGQGGEKDTVKASQINLIAADKGDKDAQFNAAATYRDGIYGFAQDHKLAAHYFRLAADQGSPRAKAELGHLHLFGLGLKQDAKEGLRLCTEAWNQGEETAYLYAGAYFCSLGDYASSIKYSKPAADKGNSEAQFNVGSAYAQVGNAKLAEKYLRLSRQMDEQRILCMLAAMHLNQSGAGLDKEKGPQ